MSRTEKNVSQVTIINGKILSKNHITGILIKNHTPRSILKYFLGIKMVILPIDKFQTKML